MAVTKEDMQDFNRFVDERIKNGGAELTLEELAFEWQTTRERDEVNAIIRRGLDDIDAGRHRPAREVTEELRQKHAIPSE